MLESKLEFGKWRVISDIFCDQEVELRDSEARKKAEERERKIVER